MGRINNRVKYPIDNIVTLDDSVIGSDFDQSGKTKNYSVRGIISLALSEGNTNISNGVLSGSVYWLQGLEFASTKIDYTFNNTLFQSESQSPIVLSPADLTNDRVDVFAIDVQTNSVVVVEGIPSANPQEPTIDFIYQIRLSSVTIPANASAPLNLETVQIYDENLGQPSEWDSTFVQNSGTINVNYPVDPSKGTKGIFFDNIPTESLNSITFTNSDIVTPSNINFDFKTINFQGILYMSLLDNLGNQVSAPITILNNSFGIDFVSGTYNTVSIPITSFGTISGDIYGLRITALPFKEGYSFLIDNILFQKGINTPNQANDTFLGLTDTFNDYFNRGFEILRVNKSATGIESVKLQDILANVALSGEYGDLLNTPQNTSNFTNDGSDGINPFITVSDVPDVPEYTLSPISGSNTFALLKEALPVSTLDLTPYDGISVQDENGIEQFQSGGVKFEGVSFDAPTNKIIVSPAYLVFTSSFFRNYNFPLNTFGWCLPTNTANTSYSSSSQTDEIQILLNNGVNSGVGGEKPFPHFIAPFDMVLASVNVTSDRDSLWDLAGDLTDVFEFFVGSFNRVFNPANRYYTKSEAQVLYKDTRTNIGGDWSYDNQDDDTSGTNFKKDVGSNLLIVPKGHSILYTYRSTIVDRTNALNIFTQLTFKKV